MSVYAEIWEIGGCDIVIILIAPFTGNASAFMEASDNTCFVKTKCNPVYRHGTSVQLTFSSFSIFIAEFDYELHLYIQLKDELIYKQNSGSSLFFCRTSF